MSEDGLLVDKPRARLFPYHFAEQYQCVLDWAADIPTLIFHDQVSEIVLRETSRLTAGKFSAERIDKAEFQACLTKIYQAGENSAEEVADVMGEDEDLSALVDAMPDAEELMSSEDDAPVIRLINAVLAQAINSQASDIHVETFEQRLVIRFRIDGVLTEVLSPKRVLAPLLVSRLKVMAKLDIAEKRVPQDGRISVKIAGHAIDLRVSTLPSAYGERVVLRILDKQSSQLDLDQLRMPPDDEARFKHLLAQPHGIILVTGPTGSGKTTSLYAGLSHINAPGRNIMTIEDPVEYMLHGIGQTQVNTKVGMTFAAGLRAILRQDPDVVMVGEIRDVETAEIAVQASLTGHLVLSTLHTNSAVGAISRLADMGVEPFLLSSSLIAVMAQRLVRLNCQDCLHEYQASETDKQWLGVAPDVELRLQKGEGCQRCSHTGYRGRQAIYELVEVSETMKQLIHDGVGDIELQKAARLNSVSISQRGRELVLAGRSTPAEVARVVEDSKQ